MEWFKKYDVLTKLISVLLALALWIYVISSNDIEKEYRVRSLEPEFVGIEEIATSKNLILVGDYTVDAVVVGKRGDIMTLGKSDIKVEVDVSTITTAGTYNLPYTVTPGSEYTLKKKIPEKLTVKFDQENVKTVPVKVVTAGITAEGYRIDERNVSVVPKELKITGLQEEVEKIAYAEVNTLRKDMKGVVSGKYEYKFYDEDGEVIKSTTAKADYDIVSVNIPILKTKEVPLTLEILGDEGMKKFVNYELNPKTIQIAGEEAIIDQITTISAGAIKISEIDPDAEKTFTIILPEDVVFEDGKLTSTAKFEFVGLSKKRIDASLIKVINADSVPNGCNVRIITDSLLVDVLGSEDSLAKVNSDNVKVVADLKSISLSKGIHTVDVQVMVDDVENVAVSNVSEYKIKLEVS